MEDYKASKRRKSLLCNFRGRRVVESLSAYRNGDEIRELRDQTADVVAHLKPTTLHGRKE